MREKKILQNGHEWRLTSAGDNVKKAMIVLYPDPWGPHFSKYVAKCGASALRVSFTPKDGGCRSFELGELEEAIAWLRTQGYQKVGILGGSTSGMIALTAASLIPDLSLVVAFTPSNYVMQGCIRGKGPDGAPEWPAPGESSMNFHGEPLPYAPFDLTPKEFNELSYAKAKNGGELSAAAVFDHVEENGVPEDAYIKVEDMNADVVCFGAADDSCWHTTRYIAAMEKRLQEHGFSHQFEVHTYDYGTHFIFPQRVVTSILPVGVKFAIGRIFSSARKHPAECEATRLDVDAKVAAAIARW